MCLTNIKNIDDIYYSRNWDNFHNKANSILVENEPIRKINLNLVIQIIQKNKLYQYSNVNFFELIEMIAELNLIMQDHAKHIHHYETDVRSLQIKNRCETHQLFCFVVLFINSCI